MFLQTYTKGREIVENVSILGYDGCSEKSTLPTMLICHTVAVLDSVNYK